MNRTEKITSASENVEQSRKRSFRARHKARRVRQAVWRKRLGGQAFPGSRRRAWVFQSQGEDEKGKEIWGIKG